MSIVVKNWTFREILSLLSILQGSTTFFPFPKPLRLETRSKIKDEIMNDSYNEISLKKRTLYLYCNNVPNTTTSTEYVVENSRLTVYKSLKRSFNNLKIIEL